MNPTVSIIIPSYNKAQFIKDTLQSVLAQTYPNWECLIIDDGSADGSVSIINEFTAKDNRFVFLAKDGKLKKGPSSSRNLGLRAAKGEYIVFLDADDLLATDCLENRIKLFEGNKENDFLVFQMQRFQNQPDYSIKKKVVSIPEELALQSFIQLHGVWPITGPVYKTTVLKSVGGFQENLMNYEDFELAVKILLKSENYAIFETVDCYYRNDDDYTSKYSGIETKTKMIVSFGNFLKSIDAFLITENIEESKSELIKGLLLGSYKKVFRSIILEDVHTFRMQNKLILDFLSQNDYLNPWQWFKCYFVQHVLFKLCFIKGLGVFRIIKYLYK
ncbi:glycosyltransferase [Flavobacterium amniphilum]|uniref:glycosyltransferase family 2 protein n=1 Tax=Flavobacterium amniphilum TaxID=1834035 RepID=UPI00202A061B|nr:glycosyltransferase [Flavobacterium amniphilum]MCL9805109.1 glycosyltransferase [Flavobacterium amniphilum]